MFRGTKQKYKLEIHFVVLKLILNVGKNNIFFCELGTIVGFSLRKFDAVVASEIIEHVDNPQLFIQSISLLLKVLEHVNNPQLYIQSISLLLKVLLIILSFFFNLSLFYSRY